MDLAQFRADFPAFADETAFPDSSLSFWARIGEGVISADRFGDLYTQAVELYVAHSLTVAADAAAGRAGQVSSKTVGSVSVAYDVSGVNVANAGQWNQTAYGRQYIQLSRLMGHGACQL